MDTCKIKKDRKGQKRTEKEKSKGLSFILSENKRKEKVLMSEKVNKTKVIKGCLTEKKYEEVQKFAEETGLSVSSLVVMAVSEYIKKNKN